MPELESCPAPTRAGRAASEQPPKLTRRHILRGASAAPLVAPLVAVAAPLSGCGGANDETAPVLPALEAANRLLDRPLPADRPARILGAFEMNRAFFRAVRELEIEDRVEPPLRFGAAFGDGADG